jgi:hypothetical protein
MSPPAHPGHPVPPVAWPRGTLSLQKETALIEISMPTQHIVQGIQTTQGLGDAAPAMEITGASLDQGIVRYQVQMEGQDSTLEDQVEAVLSFLHVTIGRIVDVSYDPAGLVSYTLA